jgi:hypothetical protein
MKTMMKKTMPGREIAPLFAAARLMAAVLPFALAGCMNPVTPSPPPPHKGGG